MAAVLIRALPTASAAALALSFASVTLAQAPEVIYQFPRDGASLEEPPLAIQLCFAEPIDVRDLDKGGDFRFLITAPDGTPLGHRAIFQPDGYGVVVQPGISDEPEGNWTFEWRVRDRQSEEEAEGTIPFSVQAGGAGVIPAEPPACTASGTPLGASPTPRDDGTTDDPVVQEDDGGPDVLLLALLTVGAAGAAAAVALLGYLIRQRTGFWLHRPPDRRNGGGPPH
jgi:methionine-rich copper-binding protein CopC